MKPALLKVSKDVANSFSARRDLSPDINNKWHYHQELELVYFKSGAGTQFVGDRIKQFESGDIVLIGPNLPHHFRLDDVYFDSVKDTEIFVIHFNEFFWGESFLNLPENRPIKELVNKSSPGIHISGLPDHPAIPLFEAIVDTDGPAKIIYLMQILLLLADTNPMELLASVGFKHNIVQAGKDRIQDIYNYSILNFRHKIQLNTVAEIAGINPTSFCKYFKSRTRKTYSAFINEIRVGYACKLLLENKLSVKEICYESGFLNFSSFHAHFRKITGKSPLSYRKNVVGD